MVVVYFLGPPCISILRVLTEILVQIFAHGMICRQGIMAKCKYGATYC